MQTMQRRASSRGEESVGAIHCSWIKVRIRPTIPSLGHSLTLYRNGDRIVLEGEADQVPDQEPGDIVFHLKVFPHETFERAGADLQAALHISLVESVCGFSRVVLKHLDGRGIHLDHPRGRTLKPNQVVKVPGEGMPHKKSDSKGDLYLVVTVQFPEDGWVKDDEMSNKLQELLPKPLDPIDAETVDEVEYDQDADLDEVSCSRCSLECAS